MSDIVPPCPKADASIGNLFADVLLRTHREGECIIWDGSVSTKGYGQLRRSSVRADVHHIAFVWAYGERPSGTVLDHLCHDPGVCTGGLCIHRRCVNPDHIAAVSNSENLARQSPAHKVMCAQGHPYTPENTGRNPAGKRYCRACNRDRSSRYTYEFSVPSSEVRKWAIGQGLLTKRTSGRLPAAVVAAWNNANPDRPYETRRVLKVAS